MKPLMCWSVALAVAGLFWQAAPLVADHPFHSTRATVEFNAETASFEVSLFAFPDDLADALSAQAGRKVALESEANIDELLQKYVADKFQLRLGTEKAATMHWIGHEFETQQAWLYFEFPVDTESPSEIGLKNTILMEQFDDQINVAYIRVGGRQRCLTHRTDTPSWEKWDLRQRAAEGPNSAKVEKDF